MPVPIGKAELKLQLPEALIKRIREEARERDVAVTGFVEALLRGALYYGERIVLKGESLMPHPPTALAHRPVPWVATRRPPKRGDRREPMSQTAAVWRYGRWVLERRPRQEGDAGTIELRDQWWLSGPGVSRPQPYGRHGGRARREASLFIIGVEQEEGAGE